MVRQYGTGRLKEASLFPQRPGTLVLTTYGHLRSDAQMLENVDWSVLALDEAQNVKNSLSKVTKAVRTLRGSHRFALTGTPMENRLAELWSILEFANPGVPRDDPELRAHVRRAHRASRSRGGGGALAQAGGAVSCCDG